MFRGSSGKKFLLSTSMTILVMTYSLTLLISNSDMLAATRIMAAPLAQNPYSECPPNSNNIWVQLDDNNFNGQSATLSIPFDTGQVTIGSNIYINYLLGVLISEVAPTTDFDPVDDETLKAMAIAARTVAYKNCGLFTYAGHRGIDDNDKQVYDPTKRDLWLNDPSLGQAELDRYQQAIDDTAGMYLTYNGAVFDAQYRDKSDNTTDDFDEDNNGIFAPHKGIYDYPSGKFHPTPSVIKPGLMQVNSNHWATGENHSENLTPWNYRQILAHYYTGIHLRDGSGNILTPEYRWNPLDVNWSTTPPLFPSFTPSSIKTLNVSIQNSGVITWTNTNNRVAYQWQTLGGAVVGQGTGVTLFTIELGSSVGLGPVLSVQAPATPGIYTLIIDMRANDGGGYTYFHNREANRPWYPLEYICMVSSGGQCYFTQNFPRGGGIYLPIIQKNAS